MRNPEADNPLIALYLASGLKGGVNALKKIYRERSKQTHPDTPTGSAEAFHQLRVNYEEALAWLAAGPDETVPPADPPELFYTALEEYTLKGFHTQKARERESLKPHFLKLTADMKRAARFIDPALYRTIVSYSQPQAVPAFEGRDTVKRYQEARKAFQDGLSWLFQFRRDRFPSALRVALSFFRDAAAKLMEEPANPTVKALADFARWFVSEWESMGPNT